MYISVDNNTLIHHKWVLLYLQTEWPGREICFSLVSLTICWFVGCIYLFFETLTWGVTFHRKRVRRSYFIMHVKVDQLDHVTPDDLVEILQIKEVYTEITVTLFWFKSVKSFDVFLLFLSNLHLIAKPLQLANILWNHQM